MIIGVDMGGTSLKAALIMRNKIMHKASIKTGSHPKEVMENLFHVIEEVSMGKKIKAIGIGCPGPADYGRGVIGNTPNIPLRGVHVKDLVSEKFKCPVIMENDANCFVLGESMRLKKKNVVGLTLGTGVGGGIVIDGKIYLGRGNAGHLGHTTIKFDGRKSECHNDGCLEQYVSKKGIEKQFGKSPTKLTKKEWEKIGMYLGIGITNIANSFDPDVVVLGGGISQSITLFGEKMQSTIAERALHPIRIVLGKKDSALIGAGSLVSSI